MSARRSRHAAPQHESPVLTRAINVFEFLTRAQQLRSRRVRTTDSYEADGQVVWLGELPSHRAVRYPASTGEPTPDEPILSVRRMPRSQPPEPPDELLDWITGDLDNADEEPQLREQLPIAEVDEDDWPEALVEDNGLIRPDDNPVIGGRFDGSVKYLV